MIISGFPGVGKTYCWQNKGRVLDSDSSSFSWLEEGVRHPDFPQNYIDDIKEKIALGEIFGFDLIFVSSHAVVRKALVDNGLPFVLVYPEAGLKQEYMERFRLRGSCPTFVDMISDNWDKWMTELEAQRGCQHVRLKAGEYLSDWLDKRTGVTDFDRLKSCFQDMGCEFKESVHCLEHYAPDRAQGLKYRYRNLRTLDVNTITFFFSPDDRFVGYTNDDPGEYFPRHD